MAHGELFNLGLYLCKAFLRMSEGSFSIGNDSAPLAQPLFLKAHGFSEIQMKFNDNIQKIFVSTGVLDAGMSFVLYKESSIEDQVDLFRTVINDLLGDDLLIPYNIEDRKKKFPKAFKELEPYMRKYLKEK